MRGGLESGEVTPAPPYDATACEAHRALAPTRKRHSRTFRARDQYAEEPYRGEVTFFRLILPKVAPVRSISTAMQRALGSIRRAFTGGSGWFVARVTVSSRARCAEGAVVMATSTSHICARDLLPPHRNCSEPSTHLTSGATPPPPLTRNALVSSRPTRASWPLGPCQLSSLSVWLWFGRRVHSQSPSSHHRRTGCACASDCACVVVCVRRRARWLVCWRQKSRERSNSGAFSARVGANGPWSTRGGDIRRSIAGGVSIPGVTLADLSTNAPSWTRLSSGSQDTRR